MKEEDKTRGINANQEKRYVLIRGEQDDSQPIILNGQKELVKSFNSSSKSDSDRYYELGPEVRLKTTVEIVPETHVVHRKSSKPREIW